MSTRQQIRTAQSCAGDARAAVREFHAGVAQPDMALVVFFCSSEYDLDALADEMAQRFGGTPVVGCTTAGEIGPLGCRRRSLAGLSFSGASTSVVTGLLGDLKNFQPADGSAFAQSLLQRLEPRTPFSRGNPGFAFLLIDGLSLCEEPVARSFQNALGRVPVIGGSAGDDMAFARTLVYHAERFHSDSAVLVLFATVLPFRIFKIHHFVSTDVRMVVTDADAENRVVREINGHPAAHEYARLVGVDPGDDDPMRFAATPVAVLFDGTDHIRSIRSANPDGSLSFYCAIEEGMVLRVARGVNLMHNLEQTLHRIETEIGMPQVMLGCHCVLRTLEIAHADLQVPVEEILRRYRTVAFGSYGEQYCGVHVNQTFTGVALGGLEGDGDA